MHVVNKVPSIINLIYTKRGAFALKEYSLHMAILVHLDDYGLWVHLNSQNCARLNKLLLFHTLPSFE